MTVPAKRQHERQLAIRRNVPFREKHARLPRRKLLSVPMRLTGNTWKEIFNKKTIAIQATKDELIIRGMDIGPDYSVTRIPVNIGKAYPLRFVDVGSARLPIVKKIFLSRILNEIGNSEASLILGEDKLYVHTDTKRYGIQLFPRKPDRIPSRWEPFIKDMDEWGMNLRFNVKMTFNGTDIWNIVKGKTGESLKTFFYLNPEISKDRIGVLVQSLFTRWGGHRSPSAIATIPGKNIKTPDGKAFIFGYMNSELVTYMKTLRGKDVTFSRIHPEGLWSKSEYQVKPGIKKVDITGHSIRLWKEGTKTFSVKRIRTRPGPLMGVIVPKEDVRTERWTKDSKDILERLFREKTK